MNHPSEAGEPRSPRLHNRYRRLWTCTSLALALLFSGCEHRQQAGAVKAPIPEVNVIVADETTVPIVFQHVAQIQSPKSISIQAKVGGYLVHRPYVEGSIVKKGAVLFEIDHRPYEAAVEQAAAQVDSAKATLKLTEDTFARQKNLMTNNVASPQDYDTAVANRDSAKANVLLAQAKLRDAQLDLEYTTITAPMTGRVGLAQMDVGNLVSTNANATLTQMVQVEPMYVYFSVSERELLSMRQGRLTGKYQVASEDQLLVRLTLADGSTYAHDGKLDFMDIQISPQTGTAQVRAEMPNPHGLLMAGQYVTMHLLGVLRVKVMVVPQKAVIQTAIGQMLAVLNKDNEVEQRPVTVGTWTGDNWIIETGLKPGDRVVVDGITKVAQGTKVKPVTVALDLPSTATDVRVK